MRGIFGAPAGTRILDPLIKSHSICGFVRLCEDAMCDKALLFVFAVCCKPLRDLVKI
nr:MAG TPA: hypothetical protein [Caudoviricetes sp.]